MFKITRWVIVFALLMLGCTSSGGGSIVDTTYTDLVTGLDAARQSQAAALALWDRVIFGEVVSCQDFIPVPPPVQLSAQLLAAHPGADAIQARLNEAIQAIHDSSDLWNIECAFDRATVPLNMAKSGRAAALAATAPLDTAAQMLAAWGG
ncbi:MAG: hypothetical protein HY866_15325 [Chloroflexi bacterium]|nr:hypothetical protein [Chloroflexota bacterium]